ARAESLEDTRTRQEMGRSLNALSADPLMTALRTWISRDTDSAAEWIEQIRDEKKKHALLRSVISLTAHDDPQRALLWAAQERDAETRAAVVPALAEQLANLGGLGPQDAQTALELAKGLTGD